MIISFKRNLGNMDRTIRILMGSFLLIEGILGYWIIMDMLGWSTYKKQEK
jgi:hypothetical protein